jgi:transcriptional regulator
MYIPKNFKNEDQAEIFNFIENNSFGILVNQGDSKILATHIPLYLTKNAKGDDILLGHISKGNEAWKCFNEKQDVLVIFSGPHAYVSSSWYDHENVPTWNYIAVHVYGVIRIIEGEILYDSLKVLVDKYERTVRNPVSVDRMSKDFIHREMKGIVGFQIEIKEMQAAYKLSQNRDAKNYDAVVAELEKSTDKNATVLADEMKRRKP